MRREYPTKEKKSFAKASRFLQHGISNEEGKE